MPKKPANWWEDPGRGSQPGRTWWSDSGHGSGPGDGSERKTGNAQATGRRKFSKKFLVAASGGLATVASVISIVAFIQSQHHPGTPTFDADLTTSASQFAGFLSGVDGKIVYIDVECGMPEANGHWPWSASSKCAALNNNYGTTGGDQDYRYILSLGSFSAPAFVSNGTIAGNLKDDAQTAFVDVDVVPNTSAQVFNGVHGAGWIEVKGYFSVSKYQLGTAPPGSADYTLSSVSQSISTQ